MIVFDLDDTLYYERDFVESGQNFLCQINASNRAFDINGKWDEDTLTLFRNHIPQIRLSEETIRTLNQLKAKDVKIGMITDGRSITQRNKFNALGLDNYVDDSNLIISEEIGAVKISGLPFKEIMRRNLDETSWVYVADNPNKDFIAPNLLGWTTVMLLDTLKRNIHTQDLPKDINYHPQIIIKNLEELLIY